MRHAIDFLEPATQQHSYRVAEIAREITEKYNIDSDIGLTPELAYLCGLYHDIGKIYVPDELLKSESQNGRETERLKEHVLRGKDYIMRSSEFAKMKNADKALIALCAHSHHENCWCTGYPLRSNIDNLPLIVGLIKVIDFYDNATNQERYKRIMDERIAVALMVSQAGGEYPVAAIKVFKEWYSLKTQD